MSARLSGAPAPLADPGGRLGGRRSIPLRLATERTAYGLFALFIFFTCFTFLRPSPYDFIALLTMPVWLVLGLRINRAVLRSSAFSSPT